MRKLNLILFALILLLNSCSKSESPDPIRSDPPPPPPAAQKDIASIDNAVQSFMNKYSVPGVSVAITKQGKLVYVKSYGKQSASDNTPVTNSSLYRIASVSKSVTAVGVMKLLEAGKLTMDSKIFGSGGILAAQFPSAPAATHDITVRHLLHHTTGVWGNDGNDPMFKNENYNFDELIKWTLANYPANTGRGTYRYSNFGYCLLGRVIEKLSGKSYEKFIQDEVLTPSGITKMKIGANTLVQRMTDEVVYTGQGGYSPYNMNISRMDANGGWIASATDLAKFLVRVDGLSTVPDILKSETITTMITPSVPSSNYACGWGVNSANNWWHVGSLPGTAAEIIRTPGGFNWVVLTNSRSYQNGFDTDLDNLLWPVIVNNATPWQDINQF